LIVDDNHDAANTLCILLEYLGADVLTVHSGAAALEAIPKYRPAIALVDIGMPEIDGNEVARRARRLPGGRDLILIALTGWGQDEARRRSREAGFDQHLVKPVDVEALQALLSSMLETRKSAGESSSEAVPS